MRELQGQRGLGSASGLHLEDVTTADAAAERRRPHIRPVTRDARDRAPGRGARLAQEMPLQRGHGITAPCVGVAGGAGSTRGGGSVLNACRSGTW